jgi:hypothetical protein
VAKVKIKASAAAVEQASKSGDFEEAPPGLYTATLEEINPGFSKGDDGKEDKSRPYLECIYKITGVGREGTAPDKTFSRLWDYVTFGEAAEWKQAQFGMALGLPMSPSGSIEGSIETEPGKPGTVIGTTVLIRVKRGTDLEGNYRGKIAWVGNKDSATKGETSSVFADDEEETGPANPFDDASGDETADYVTEEQLLAMEPKELGDLAREFDLDPADLLVRKGKSVDVAATQAAIVAAVLAAQGAGDTDGGEEAESPF